MRNAHCHDHGNCELCDELDKVIADLKSELTRTREELEQCDKYAKEQYKAYDEQLAFWKHWAGEMAKALELTSELLEINPVNYDHDEVCNLNSRVDEVCRNHKEVLAAFRKAGEERK